MNAMNGLLAPACAAGLELVDAAIQNDRLTPPWDDHGQSARDWSLMAPSRRRRARRYELEWLGSNDSTDEKDRR